MYAHFYYPVRCTCPIGLRYWGLGSRVQGSVHQAGERTAAPEDQGGGDVAVDGPGHGDQQRRDDPPAVDHLPDAAGHRGGQQQERDQVQPHVLQRRLLQLLLACTGNDS